MEYPQSMDLLQTRVYLVCPFVCEWGKLADFLAKSKDNIDPESTSSNATNYPQSKIINVGFTVTFLKLDMNMKKRIYYVFYL